MATYSISPEWCRGIDTRGLGSWTENDGRTGLRIPCLTVTQGGGIDGRGRPDPRLGDTERQRWWRTHPAEAQAAADAAEVPIESLLCKGCQKMYARLVRAGEWP